jgi:hypothetical protein
MPDGCHEKKNMRDKACAAFIAGQDLSVIAQCFGKCERTIERWIERYADSELENAEYTRDVASRYKLSPLAVQCLITTLDGDPALYYDEVQFRIWARTDEVASLSTIQRLGKELGYDDKVSSTVSHRRVPEIMRLHAECRDLFHWKQFIFVDEVHKRGRDMKRKRAKGRFGAAAYTPLSVHLGRAWTVLACANWQGIKDFEIQELASNHNDLPRALDRAAFMHMFRLCVLPWLNPCDDRCLDNSVVIIDNCKDCLWLCCPAESTVLYYN